MSPHSLRGSRKSPVYSAYGYPAAIALLLLILIPRSVFGTCIIAVKNRAGVFLAADSKQTDNTGTETRWACKILRGNGFYWAAAGPIYSDPTTGFEVAKLVQKVGKNGTLLHKINQLVSNTRKPLSKELGSIKLRDPLLYSEIIAGKKALLEVVFVGREKGQPTFAWVNFTAREIGQTVVVDGKPAIAEEPTLDKPTFAVGLGEYKDAFSYLQSHGGSLLNNPSAVIRQSMSIEESVESTIVGGKISMLHLDESHDDWIDKAECQ